MSQICIGAALVVAFIISMYAKNPLTDKDYIHDINLDTNRRFQSVDGFKLFIKKYDPVDVFENIAKQEKARGRNYTITEKVDLVLDGIDPTSSLLKLKVQNGNPKVIPLSSSRRQFRQYQYNETWTPPRGISVFPNDRFSFKPRLYELMKQAIYQARNRMVIMQLMRDKYRSKPMYKMGYLMSKTDNACKVFNKVAFHTFRTCHRQLNAKDKTRDIHRELRFRMYELQVAHTRILHLWFQVELLTDLAIHNDINYYDAYERKQIWNFTD